MLKQLARRLLNPVPAVTRGDVLAAYRSMLGREPESEEAIAKHMKLPSAEQLIKVFGISAEFLDKRNANPFYFYHGTFDVRNIIRAHEDKDRASVPGHLVNFLGVAMNVRFVPELAGHEGHVEGLPVPANWHAEMSEFAAVLRAVELEKDRFTMIELGCGWGCWMNNSGVAARRKGLTVRLIGVEGDEGHIGFAREALATNGFAPGEYKLWRGIAGARTGTALFPKQNQSGADWGLEPKFDLPADERDALLKGGRYDELPILDIRDVIEREPRISLVHMDIQGGEADFVRDCMVTLVEKVSYLVIGTHSRQIEARLLDSLLGAGWALELERPSDFEITADGPVTTIDGIQAWRNPRLAPI
jgi:hypothetical protein